jgi:hypothetical protein
VAAREPFSSDGADPPAELTPVKRRQNCADKTKDQQEIISRPNLTVAPENGRKDEMRLPEPPAGEPSRMSGTVTSIKFQAPNGAKLIVETTEGLAASPSGSMSTSTNWFRWIISSGSVRACRVAVMCDR